jgi:hypothetical protein
MPESPDFAKYRSWRTLESLGWTRTRFTAYKLRARGRRHSATGAGSLGNGITHSLPWCCLTFDRIQSRRRIGPRDSGRGSRLALNYEQPKAGKRQAALPMPCNPRSACCLGAPDERADDFTYIPTESENLSTPHGRRRREGTGGEALSTQSMPLSMKTDAIRHRARALAEMVNDMPKLD